MQYIFKIINLLSLSFVFRLFLIINSLSLSFFIFAVHKNFTLDWIEQIFSKLVIKLDITIISYVFYFICIILLSLGSIWLINKLSDDEIDEDTLRNIEPANDAFLPSYLGYFFVALSVPDIKIFFVVFGIIAIFIYFSRISYFNPMFFIFGYKFFYVTNSNNVKILLITKKELKTTQSAKFENLKRITNYTFIDMDKGEK